MARDVEAAILLDRMPQQTEVRVQEDDWTGRTDAAARRKLQNRLNQRIWRKDYPWRSRLFCLSPELLC
jgi:hypothetical protein